MNRLSILACTALVLLTAAPALAQDFNLDWHTVDGGGGMSIGGGYVLIGTAGQPDASALIDGGSFDLTGGFWYPADVVAPACAADLFPASDSCDAGDGVVGPGDLAVLLSSWGSCTDCCADLAPAPGGDNIVGPADLAVLLAVWGQCG